MATSPQTPTPFVPLREKSKLAGFKKGDVLVVFGELFARGYANGIVDEAKRLGMNIVYSTVGRRDADQKLRSLNDEELAEKDKPLINIPLEAGFDLEPDSKGVRPVDQLKEYGLTGWETAKLDWANIEEAKANGRKRFRKSVEAYMAEVEKHIPNGANVLFVHTMAGGFPRAKVVMPIANRVFKGTGARFMSSKMYWESEIGQLCSLSFNEVTAHTFSELIESSSALRTKIEKAGGKVAYAAYGYHGNEALIKGQYTWFSYSPYLQGWAKVELEKIASEAYKKGIAACVYNVPEILTNSSSIFLGVEISLYSLIAALRREQGDSPKVKALVQKCEALLKDGYTYADVEKVTSAYLENPIVFDWPKFENWPQHNGPEQMDLMRQTSSAMLDMHKDQKNLLTAELSEIVFEAAGEIMLAEAMAPRAPALWIGHDLVAKSF